MKQYLAGEKRNVARCKKVPPKIRFMIQGSLKENVERAKEKRGSSGIDEYAFGASVHEFSYDDYTTHAKKESHKQQPKSSKKKAKTGLESFFKIGTHDLSQPTIKASLQSKEKWHDTNMAIAFWFYDSYIPLNACNSPFFQIAMSKVASMGHGYAGPSCHALRVSLLKDAKKQVALIVDSFRKVLSELLDYIDTRVDTGGNKTYNEISLYRDRQKSFARPTAMTIARSTRPDDWWKLFDIGAPSLQKLEHQRLNDLVYVHYNLRLQNIVKYSKRPYDPVDYECIDKSEFWIVEKTPEGELDYDEIEELLKE
ncbi:UNVERIFIED_CONTAM: hypothetical protein Sangu_1561000 [Sesamum angustifolium]|uniref:Uncharacterized protein n=1 Tax=Sesamum angustifolium TaxID=2727405 RepID=A0AAW2MTJ3_9LAMI